MRRTPAAEPRDVLACDGCEREFELPPALVDRLVAGEPESWEWDVLCPECARGRQEFEVLRRGRYRAQPAGWYQSDEPEE